MPGDNTYPLVTFQNKVTNTGVIIYDSYTNDDAGTNNNYFGTLTNVLNLPVDKEQTVQPLHGPISAYIAFDTHSVPIGRYIAMGLDPVTFNITNDDVAAMNNTFGFLNFLHNYPNDPVATDFNNLISNNQFSPQQVDDFFAKTTQWKNCGFQTFMLAITAWSATTHTANNTPDKKTYSLSKLCTYLGGQWPAGFPDIEVSDFSCNTGDQSLTLTATIDLRNLPFETEAVAGNVLSLLPSPTVRVQFYFNYKIGLALGFTRLKLLFDNIDLKVAGNTTITIDDPTITLDISPLFKFVVFTVQGSIPFNIFNKTFKANLSMTIDNVEAHVGVVIEGDNTSLPGPPAMQGVHFDSFGVGMGIFFEPPGFAIGLQGQFHIGEAGKTKNVQLDDSQFAVVCRIEEEVPNPIYASFYVPKMDLNEVITLFTNTKVNVDVPVEFTDLSFKWAESPMEPITLPDGSLTDMSYGFSGAVNILSFGFYGDAEINIDHGLTANLEMSPFSISHIFQLSGDGKGVTIKVDQQGNPIKNNQIADTATLQNILKTATGKQLVAPGGPVLAIRTFESPILHINGKVSLFDLVNYAIKADVKSDGITFHLNYGAVLSGTMDCTLDHFHNLTAAFQFGLNRSISLPSVTGVSLGSLHLVATVNAHLQLYTSASDVVLKVGGHFDFEGLNRPFGDFSADLHIQKISELITAMATYIEQQAKTIFNDLLGKAEVWAGKVKEGVIASVNTVSDVLRYAYSKSAPEVASIMRNAGYAASEVAGGIKRTFGLGIDQITSALNAAGYGVNEIASALSGIFNVKDIAASIQRVFGYGAEKIGDVLKQAGFSTDEIGDAFKSLGGEFEKAAKKALDVLNPSHW